MREKAELSILAKGERGIAGARGTAHNRRRGGMAKFKIVTPVGASFSIAGVGYKLEIEGLGSLDAEIVEIADGTEDEFVKAARDADALYAKGRLITKRMIDGLEHCKVPWEWTRWILPQPRRAASPSPMSQTRSSKKLPITP
jgi:hypothetical protein